ncbi:hypothetical protein QWY16_11635 [Planococcus shenhongbingii]|uniref:hypothetical protein n=1 Tax=Planococcus shenhongbingii TaxID=3058398 RepID=UPI0026111761|nr:hypothetical protein [Planococcus sp. N016]WKA57152.1 hypothetical protein QWY16_11635 [Planococcus sp. N016]
MNEKSLKGFFVSFIVLFIIDNLILRNLSSVHWSIGLVFLILFCLLGGYVFYVTSKQVNPIMGGASTLLYLILVDMVFGKEYRGNFVDDYGYYIVGFFLGIVGLFLATKVHFANNPEEEINGSASQ